MIDPIDASSDTDRSLAAQTREVSHTLPHDDIMDIAVIPGLVSNLKAATDVAKALYDLKLSADVQAKVSELQSALLAAQTSALTATAAQFELQERVRQLEAQLRAAEDWRSTKLRYALVTPWRGPAQAYALRRAEANGEQPHLVCTNCFEDGKRIILNPVRQGRTFMICPACKASLDTGYSGVGAAKYAEEYVHSEAQGRPDADD